MTKDDLKLKITGQLDLLRLKQITQWKAYQAIMKAIDEYEQEHWATS